MARLAALVVVLAAICFVAIPVPVSPPAAAAAELTCGLTLQASPDAGRRRIVQRPCDGTCRFALRLCDTGGAPACAAESVVAFERGERAAAVSLSLPRDGDCGEPLDITIRAGERRRYRVLASDPSGRRRGRRTLVLVCRTDDDPSRCPAATTTTLGGTGPITPSTTTTTSPGASGPSTTTTTRPGSTGSSTTTTTLPGPHCVIDGCNGELCAAEPTGSLCWWFPAFICFRSADCAIQADGACGWTASDTLLACIAGHGGLPDPYMPRVTTGD